VSDDLVAALAQRRVDPGQALDGAPIAAVLGREVEVDALDVAVERSERHGRPR
jgi:hypothetical protein